jgi:hypothetical protein
MTRINVYVYPHNLFLRPKVSWLDQVSIFSTVHEPKLAVLGRALSPPEVSAPRTFLV